MPGSDLTASLDSTVRVSVSPKTVFGATMLCGAVLGYAFPVPIFQESSVLNVTLGASLIAGGLWLNASAKKEFKKYDTPVPHGQRVSSLVSTGPFSWTRNPLYLCCGMLQAGVALAANNAMVAAPIVPLWWWLERSVIPAEEEVLMRVFGEDYRKYKNAVRKWF